MRPDLSVSRIPDSALLPGREGAGLVIRAAGRTPLEEGRELGPPPAAAERAQRAFESMGVILLLLIALTAAWILIRRRL